MAKIEKRTKEEKKELLDKCLELVRSGYSYKKACATVGIAYSTFCIWRDTLTAPEHTPKTRAIDRLKTKQKGDIFGGI